MRRLALLSDVAEVSAGQPAPQGTGDYGADGTPFIRAGSLLQLSTGGSEEELERIPPAVARREGLRLYAAGTVVFAKSGMSATKGLVYVTRGPAHVVSHLTAITPGSDLDAEYLVHWLRWRPPTSLIRDLSYPSIRLADIRRLQIPLPPVTEQRRIAAILDRADAARRKRQQTLDLADQFLGSAFLDMFGDPMTNPRGWPVRKLQDAFATDRPPTKCGPFGSALRKEEYVESGIPVLTMDNIARVSFALEGCLFVSQKKWEALSQYEVQPGDIIISRAGTVGKMCVVPNLGVPAIISTNLIRLSLNPQILEPAYFVALMTYWRGRVGNLRTGADGAYSFMNTGILRDLHVPFPSRVTQAAWRRLLAMTSNWASELLLNRTGLEKLSASLLQSAFRAGP